MNKQWFKEIQELVAAGILTEETAQNIVSYYQLKKENEPNRFTIVLAILGALLVGSGIILIIAHNWDDLSRLIKTIVAFLPLVLGQSLCLYTLLKQKQNAAWRECSSVLLFFAIGGCISIISQVYNISGSLTGFLLTWILLALPLVYLLSSSTVALLCIAGITWYAIELGNFDRVIGIPYMYVVTMALVAPHYYYLYKTRPASNYISLLNWMLCLSLTITLRSFITNPIGYEWVLLLYLVLFCIFYYVGRFSFFEERNRMANSFRLLGVSGTLFILFLSSFNLTWKQFDIDEQSNIFFILIPFICIVCYLVWNDFRRRHIKMQEPTGFSFIIFILAIHSAYFSVSLSVFVVNAWLILIAIYYMRKGSKEDHLGVLNFGLSIMAILAICRFFDSSIDFIWRGMFFIITGLGFFLANYFLLRKRRQRHKLINT